MDEKEHNLPAAAHAEVSINISDITGLYCCSNVFIIEGN